jgi:catechol 2,3-dioxygenase-like lactoylglutathione lyase family enzyme
VALIRHTDLVVTSLSRSLDFYRGLFSVLGWNEYTTVKGERGETIIYLGGPQGFQDGALGLRERLNRSHSPYDRYSVGLHHLAFNAPSRDDVDRCGDWLIRRGAAIESGPEEYYLLPYYAIFFYDPDDMKLEVVHMEPRKTAPGLP